MKAKDLGRLLGLTGLGLLAAYEVDHILGASRYKAWVFDAGESIDAAARLGAGDTLVAGNYHRVLALEGATGRRKWSFTPPEGSENLAAAPVVGPEDTVSIPSEREGKPSRVFALDEATGRPRRVIDQPASALVPGDHSILFLGFHQVIALDTSTGKPLWSFQPPPPAGADLSSGDGHVEALARARHTLYAVFGCPVNMLYALDASTGQPRWRASQDRSGEFPCSVPASLMATDDGTPVLSLLNGFLCAYEARTGHPLWQLHSLGGFQPARLQAGPGGVLYAGTDQGTLVALNTRTGARIWERRLGAKISHPPVVSPDGVLYVGTNANAVYALDAGTGRIRWNVPLGGPSRDYVPGYGEDVSLTPGPNGTVYAASSNGQIAALRSPQ